MKKVVKVNTVTRFGKSVTMNMTSFEHDLDTFLNGRKYDVVEGNPPYSS